MAAESKLERKLVQNCKKAGYKALKFVPTFANGYPDRVVLYPGGLVWVELKASEKHELRPLQKERMAELRKKYLQNTWVVRCDEDIKDLLEFCCLQEERGIDFD